MNDGALTSTPATVLLDVVAAVTPLAGAATACDQHVLAGPAEVEMDGALGPDTDRRDARRDVLGRAELLVSIGLGECIHRCDAVQRQRHLHYISE